MEAEQTIPVDDEPGRSSRDCDAAPRENRAVTACPACGDSEGVRVGHGATAFDSVVGGRSFHQPAYGVRQCVTCDLHFKSHTLRPEDLGEYYAGLECETYEHGDGFPTDQFLRGKLAELAGGSKVLDFGCSTGRILKTQTGRLRCFGVEVNETAAVIAKQRGIEVVPEDQLGTGELCGFAAILLTDVYEHLPRPLDLLETLTRLLRPGGWLVLVTGSTDAIRRRDRIAEFWYFRIAGHLHMLNERHLGWLAARLGLTLETLHRCSHYGTPLTQRLRQSVQSFAFHHFQSSPHSGVAAVLRALPVVNRAERWPSAPALTFTADHIVTVLAKR